MKPFADPRFKRGAVIALSLVWLALLFGPYVA